MYKIVNITKNYLEFFSKKNIKKLSELLSDDVILRDWENAANGKQDVLKVNKEIFAKAKSIKVNLISLNVIEKKAYCELEIIINKTEKLLVLDILNYNEDNKICKINAYKG